MISLASTGFEVFIWSLLLVSVYCLIRFMFLPVLTYTFIMPPEPTADELDQMDRNGAILLEAENYAHALQAVVEIKRDIAIHGKLSEQDKANLRELEAWLEMTKEARREVIRANLAKKREQEHGETESA